MSLAVYTYISYCFLSHQLLTLVLDNNFTETTRYGIALNIGKRGCNSFNSLRTAALQENRTTTVHTFQVSKRQTRTILRELVRGMPKMMLRIPQASCQNDMQRAYSKTSISI